MWLRYNTKGVANHSVGCVDDSKKAIHLVSVIIYLVSLKSVIYPGSVSHKVEGLQKRGPLLIIIQGHGSSMTGPLDIIMYPWAGFEHDISSLYDTAS